MVDIGERPVDRRELAKLMPPKESGWPRTERRERRISGVIRRRQPDLTVVIENVHDAHNISAVLRSCDAVGVMRIHMVYTIEDEPSVFARRTSGSASKWVETVRHESVAACYATLRDSGFGILVTSLEDNPVQLYDVDMTRPTALVFGNEARGASAEAHALADGTFFIPMQGMVESLNISVACAVSLYEAMRQRLRAGAYAEPKLGAEETAQIKEEWIRR